MTEYREEIEMRGGWKAMPYKDAFLVALEKDGRYEYFYAVGAAIAGKGDHYYVVDEDGFAAEVTDEHIISMMEGEKDYVKDVCPCLTIRDGHIVPLVSTARNQEAK